MTYYDLAKLIPREFRLQILENNVIYKAVPQAGDAHMKMLLIYFKNYINPGMEPVDINNPCQRCLADVVDKFKLLEPYLVALEREYNLLES